MSKLTYVEIEKLLPTLVKSELLTDAQREIFAEEFGPKRKTKFKAYLCWFFLSAHRWYVSGKPGLTILQWALNLCFGIGLLWLLWDMFQIPKLVRLRNHEIAKNLLAQQKIIGGAGQSTSVTPSIVNVNNSMTS